MDDADRLPLPAPRLADRERAPAAESGAATGRPYALLPTVFLGEPSVILKDPPAIFGGASHTW